MYPSDDQPTTLDAPGKVLHVQRAALVVPAAHLVLLLHERDNAVADVADVLVVPATALAAVDARQIDLAQIVQNSVLDPALAGGGGCRWRGAGRARRVGSAAAEPAGPRARRRVVADHLLPVAEGVRVAHRAG